jgi:hypothetical protein
VNAAGKLAAFAVVLGGALGGGAALGAFAGPIDVDDPPEHGEHEPTSRSADPQAASGATNTEREIDMAENLPGGVLVSQAGYTLDVDDTTLDGVAGAPFRFRITGPDGSAVRDFDLGHERELHLIVVGRDLRTYAHLHPTRSSDGTWSAELPTLAPGAYRAFADFAVTDGPELTLGIDLTVPGPSQAAALPDAATTATVDGYEVDLAGSPVAGTESELALTVRKDGEPVTDLEPYLGAAGHLVAIRAGDLAYLHVHPLGEVAERNGPSVRFAAEVPSPGDYRLFFDFSHRGEVRTAAFTVHVLADAGAPAGTATTTTTAGHGGH